MRFETISTGDELVRGRSVDTNASWMARRAAEEGILRALHTTVGDDPEELVATLRAAAARADVVVMTGGLGPTKDDHSRTVAARAAGVELVLDPELLAELTARFEERGIRMRDVQRIQAYFPAGSKPLRNPMGTAPGFRLDLDGARIYALSGVPREMELMFDAHVLPDLIESRGPGERGAYRQVLTFGKPEAFVDEALADLFAREDLSMGVTAVFGVIKVTIQTVGPDAAARADEALAVARERLGGLVLEAPTLEESVARLLEERGLTLATAESCTGGLVGRLLTNVAGVSARYAGGVVAYANEVKVSQLSVSPETLERHGAVSEEVAREMAEGARRAFGTDLAVSVTGIAGPGGGTEEKPVGTVHFALATPDGTRHRARLLMADRELVRRFSANLALGLVRSFLLG